MMNTLLGPLAGSVVPGWGVSVPSTVQSTDGQDLNCASSLLFMLPLSLSDLWNARGHSHSVGLVSIQGLDLYPICRCGLRACFVWSVVEIEVCVPLPSLTSIQVQQGLQFSVCRQCVYSSFFLLPHICLFSILHPSSTDISRYRDLI
jgi:hypothetical protein